MQNKKNEGYESYFKMFLTRFAKNGLGMLSFWMVIAMILIGIFAPLIANDAPFLMINKDGVRFPGLFYYPEFRAVDWKQPGFDTGFCIYPIVRQSPVKQNLDNYLESPSWNHPFGTDDTGMDVFARIIWGTQISMSIGIISSVITLLIGAIIGSIAGYFGGAVDSVISRFIEMMICFPTIFLILAVLAFLPPSIFNIMIVIGLTGWTSIARLVRGEVLKVKNLDYVKNARVSGLKPAAIILRHLIPNCLTAALISTTFNVSSTILIESSLSFLGFGVQPPTPSWGAIIEVAYRYLLSDKGWWLSLFPAIAIFITVTTYNLLGEAIRDTSDPKLIQ